MPAASEKARPGLKRPGAIIRPNDPRFAETVRITLLRQQAPLFTTKCRYNAFVTGIGGGKTFAGSLRCAIACIRNPGVRGLIGANTYKQLRRVVVRNFEAALRSVRLRYEFSKSDSEFTVFVPRRGKVVPTQVIAATLDPRSESYEDLRGDEYGWAWLDEARKMTKAAYEVVIGRLRAQGMIDPHQVFLTTSPNGFDWIWELFVDKAKGDHALFRGTTRANTHLPAGYYDSLRTGYDPRLAKQELDGDFLSFAGALYYAFERFVHINDRVRYNPDWPIDLAWDFNGNPMACAIVQDYPRETWVIDEIVLKDSNVPQVLDEFRNRYGDHRGDLTIYGDAAGHTAGATAGASDYDVMKKTLRTWWKGQVHFDVPRANGAVIDRINCMNGRLRGADGKVRLWLSKKCVELRKDFEQMVPKENSRMPDKTRDRDRSHISDALGYHQVRKHPIYEFDPELDELENLEI